MSHVQEMAVVLKEDQCLGILGQKTAAMVRELLRQLYRRAFLAGGGARNFCVSVNKWQNLCMFRTRKQEYTDD